MKKYTQTVVDQTTQTEEKIMAEATKQDAHPAGTSALFEIEPDLSASVEIPDAGNFTIIDKASGKVIFGRGVTGEWWPAIIPDDVPSRDRGRIEATLKALGYGKIARGKWECVGLAPADIWAVPMAQHKRHAASRAARLEKEATMRPPSMQEVAKTAAQHPDRLALTESRGVRVGFDQ